MRRQPNRRLPRPSAGFRASPDQARAAANHRQIHKLVQAFRPARGDAFMKIVVTGSIAYDYLMSFPGKFTEQILPEHLHRLSVSFLVDSMDKRRGGCAPNIAYTLALLGEKPHLMGTA